jgi:hypothetical protein
MTKRARLQGTYTGAVEAGIDTFLVSSSELQSRWNALAAANILTCEETQIKDANGVVVGTWATCKSGEDLKWLESRCARSHGAPRAPRAAAEALICTQCR